MQKTSSNGNRHMLFTSKKKLFLEIADSTIQNAGKGLFARKPSATANAIVFKPNEFIAYYDGQVINHQELLERYGQWTAPYGIKLHHNQYEDAALSRGVGSLINHSPRRANVRFSISANNKIKIIATKNIKNNAELFVNYGNEYNFNEPVSTSTNNRKWTA